MAIYKNVSRETFKGIVHTLGLGQGQRGRSQGSQKIALWERLPDVSRDFRWKDAAALPPHLSDLARRWLGE